MSSKGIARGTQTDSVLTGHGCTATTTTNVCSSDVFINGKGVCRVGDAITVHTHSVGDKCINHTVTISAGSSTVFVDGIAVARDSDAVDAGNISSGSTNVFSG